MQIIEFYFISPFDSTRDKTLSAKNKITVSKGSINSFSHFLLFSFFWKIRIHRVETEIRWMLNQVQQLAQKEMKAQQNDNESEI